MILPERLLAYAQRAPELFLRIGEATLIHIGHTQIIQNRGDLRMFGPERSLPGVDHFCPKKFGLPELSFENVQLSQFVHDPDGIHMSAAQRLFSNRNSALVVGFGFTVTRESGADRTEADKGLSPSRIIWAEPSFAAYQRPLECGLGFCVPPSSELDIPELIQNGGNSGIFGSGYAQLNF